MAVTVSWDGLRELATFRAEHGCAISLYVDLDPSVSPTPGDATTRLNALLDEGMRHVAASRRNLTHEERQALQGDIERIRRYREQEFDREGARGLAVFSAALENVWKTIPVVDPVADAIKIGREFYLAPLVPLVGRGDGALVAVVGREQGQLLRLQSGRLRELVDRSEEQPGRHDQGGLSQSSFQRHINEWPPAIFVKSPKNSTAMYGACARRASSSCAPSRRAPSSPTSSRTRRVPRWPAGRTRKRTPRRPSSWG